MVVLLTVDMGGYRVLIGDQQTLSIHRSLSVSRALQHFFEGPQTQKLLSEFAMLRMRCRGQHLRARRYWGDEQGQRH